MRDTVKETTGGAMDNFVVKRYRLFMGLTQKEFSDLIGIKQPALAKIEARALSTKGHEAKIMEVVENWKHERILSLQNEINFIKSL